MTLDEFEGMLKQLRPGSEVGLFPPGEPDDGARGRAYELAKAHDCQIENRPNRRIVVFYRPKPGDIPF